MYVVYLCLDHVEIVQNLTEYNVPTVSSQENKILLKEVEG